MSFDTVRYTATEQKILALLSDGRPHKTQEIVVAIAPEEEGRQPWEIVFRDHPEVYRDLRAALSAHLQRLRKKLPLGETIMCVLPQGRAIHYMHLRMIGSASRE